MKNKKFNYESLDQILEEAKQQGYLFPISAEPNKVLQKKLVLDGKCFYNRILAQPVEGFDAKRDGSPSARTIERYQEMVEHGFKNLWLESVSISESGRSNPAQLWITEKNVNEFRKMVEEIRKKSEEPVYIVVQLTHSGRYSNPNGNPNPICAFSNPHIPKDNEKIILDSEVVAVEDDYAKASILAERAGFDAVDIRACHGYLINEFFAAYKRTGKYGGSFENRTRFYLNVIEKVQRAVNKIEVATRLNMYDGIPYPYGWGTNPDKPEEQSLKEPLQLIKILYNRGIRLMNITSGTGTYAPFVIRPYDTGGKEPTEVQFAGIDRMLQCAKQVKQIAPKAVVIASAFTWLREFAPEVAAGGIEQGWFDIAGFGRQTIAYPEMVEDLFQNGGLKREKCCRTCCGCTTAIKVKGEHVKCIFRK